MSTIASPRPSITSLTSASSRRPSLDSQPFPSPSVPARRNRAALRDYYGLKNTSNNSPALPPDDPATGGGGGGWGGGVQMRELDAEGFDAEEYVRQVLSKEDLEGVLRIEAGLINGTFSLYMVLDGFVFLGHEWLRGESGTKRIFRGQVDSPCLLMIECNEVQKSKD